MVPLAHLIPAAVAATKLATSPHRIARDRPDILARMQAGEFKSFRQAGLAAGIVQPTAQIPLDPEKAVRALVRHFQGDALRALIRGLAEWADSRTPGPDAPSDTLPTGGA